MMLLEQMVEAGRLAEFIDEVGAIMYEEKLHDMRWDFWLHKVFDMSFDDYVQSVKSAAQPETSGNLEATIKGNFEMMENFHPE